MPNKPSFTKLSFIADGAESYVSVSMDPTGDQGIVGYYLWYWINKIDPTQPPPDPQTNAASCTFFLFEIYAWNYYAFIIGLIPINGCIASLATVRYGDLSLLPTYGGSRLVFNRFDLAFGTPPNWATCAQAPIADPYTKSNSVLCATQVCMYFGFTNTSPFTLIQSVTTGTGYSISEYGSVFPQDSATFIVYPNTTAWIKLPIGAWSYYLGYKVWYATDSTTPPTPASPDGQGYAGFLNLNFSRADNTCTCSTGDATTLVSNFQTANPGAIPNPINIVIPAPKPPLVTKIQNYTTGLPYRGVNFSAYEETPFFPFPLQNTTWFTEQGCNTIRLPFAWEYLQPDVSSPIDWTKGCAWSYYNTVTALTATGLKVIVDMHNYMQYNLANPVNNYNTCGNNIIGQLGVNDSPMGATTAQYASAWSDIAAKFVYNPNVIFDLMNEPHDILETTLVTNYNSAIGAIRSVEAQAGGVNHLILLCGTHWSCLGVWMNATPNLSTEGLTVRSNADIFLSNNWDPPTQWPGFGGNWAISVHQYLNLDTYCCGSGAGPYVPTTPPSDILTQINFSQFVTYLQTHKFKAFMSEIGCPNDAGTISVFARVLDNVVSNAVSSSVEGGFIGVTAWGAGQYASDYYLNINPVTGNAVPAFRWAIEPILTALGAR